jgi:hypothetical protein
LFFGGPSAFAQAWTWGLGKGRRKKKKKSDVSESVLFLEAEEIFARFFFMAFLNSPCYETPKNAIKKKSNKTTEGGKKKRRKKKPHFL